MSGGNGTAGETIRVLLVEDHAAFREAMALTLAVRPGIAVVGQAGTVAEARRLLAGAGAAVDVAVLDLDLPDGNGADLIREVRAAAPAAQALILTASARHGDLARAVALGAAGTFHKATPLAEIVAAVRALGAGEPLLTPHQLQEFLRLARAEQAQERAAHAALGRLTAREREVLRALAEGLGDKEIAVRLHVSKDTVHTHVANLLKKLGVESRLQALVLAVKHGLVEVG